MTQRKDLPPGYAALVERLMALIEQWCGAEPGLPDLRWLDPGDTMFIGSLGAREVQRYLADSPDAFRLLAWLDQQTGREATVFQATVALRMLGHLPDDETLARVQSAARSRPAAVTRHAESPCPDCGAILTASTGASGRQPGAGDVGVCVYCGSFLEYGESGPRALSREAFDALPKELRDRLRLARTLQQRVVATKPGGARDA